MGLSTNSWVLQPLNSKESGCDGWGSGWQAVPDRWGGGASFLPGASLDTQCPSGRLL